MDKINYKAVLKNIDTLIFDVDGVLTDSTVIVTSDGDLLRKMNTRDGFALKTAVDCGLNVCIISGGTNEGVKKRLENLGLKNIILGSHDKTKNLKDLISKLNTNNNKIMYMGDDIPDLPVMQKVGLASCPNDAVPEIQNASKYISNIKGGEGCVRDVIEQVLKVQGKWNDYFDAEA